MIELFWVLVGLTASGIILVLPIVSLVLMVKIRNLMRTLASQNQMIYQRLEKLSRTTALAEEAQPTTAGLEPEPEVSPVEAPPVPLVSAVAEVAVSPPPLPPPAPEAVSEAAASGPTADKLPVSAPVSPAMAAFELGMAKIWNWLTIGSTYRKPGESWEYAAATHWLMRIGVMIVLGGIAFFLKYSIERGIIGPLGRVVIAIAAGLTLIAVGVRLLFKKYHLLAQALAGAGFVTLYFAFFSASTLYKLMPAGAAFAMMVVVTAASGVLAVLYETPGIALVGLIGGYATPLLIGDSGVSPYFFYTYVLLIGCGVLGISLVRRWNYFNGMSMLAGYALAFMYCADHHAFDQLTTDLIFLSAIHLLFLLSMVLSHLRLKRRSSVFEWIGLSLNAFLYWVWAYALFNPVFGRHSTGLVALVLAAVYTVLSWLYLQRAREDRVAQSIMIALGAVFLTLAPVFSLSGEWLTFTWSMQALIFVMLAKNTGVRFFSRMALLIFAIAILRGLIYDFRMFYIHPEPLGLAPFWKGLLERWLLLGALPASLFYARHLVRQHRHAGKVLGLALFLLWLMLTYESRLLARHFVPDFYEASNTVTWTAFAFALLFGGIRSRSRWLRWFGLALFGLAVVKLLLLDLADLDTLYRIVASIATGILLVLGSVLYLKYRHLFAEETDATPASEQSVSKGEAHA